MQSPKDKVEIVHFLFLLHFFFFTNFGCGLQGRQVTSVFVLWGVRARTVDPAIGLPFATLRGPDHRPRTKETRARQTLILEEILTARLSLLMGGCPRPSNDNFSAITSLSLGQTMGGSSF